MQKLICTYLIFFGISISFVFSQAGSLDPDFGDNGILFTNALNGGNSSYEHSLNIQKDGKFLIVGSYPTNMMRRYNSNGTTDPTFGNNGEVIVDLGITQYLNDIDFQSDGKIIVAGDYWLNNEAKFAIFVARFHPDGTLDTSFGNNGFNTRDFGNTRDNLVAVSIQDDDKIVLGIDRNNDDTNYNEMAVARYTANGQIDQSFAANGVYYAEIGTSVRAKSVAISSTDQIVIGGGFSFGNVTTIRLNSNGTIDSSFGINGVSNFPDLYIQVHTLTIDKSDRIIIAGTYDDPNTSNSTYGMIRLNQLGQIDSNFGNAGISSAIISESHTDIPRSINVREDGKIVLGGYTVDQFDYAIVQYNENGTVDSNFGQNGVSIVNAMDTDLADGKRLIIQNDGKIIISGRTSSGITLARFQNFPQNDQPCFATELEVGIVNGPFSNELAMVEANDQNIVPTIGDCESGWCELDLFVQNSVWFKFVAPADGTYEISTCDLADFDTQIAVYGVFDCNNYFNYILLAANDDGPEECSDYDSYLSVVNLSAGATYYILVDGFNGATGDFDIQIGGLSTAIEEVELASNLKVFPNPSSDILNVNLDLVVNEKITLQLRNSIGKVIDRQFFNGVQINTSFSLDPYPSGVYYLTIIGEESRFTEKIILSK